MTVIWFFTFLAFLVLEYITVGLVAVWFAVGAFVAWASSFFTDVILVQLFIFAVVSLITLIAVRPIAKKHFEGTVICTNSDRYIGKSGVVTKEISPLNYGEVSVLGVIWTASCREKLTVGTNIIVEKIEGSKLIVRKEED